MTTELPSGFESDPGVVLLHRLNSVRVALRGSKSLTAIAPFSERIDDIDRRLDRLTREVHDHYFMRVEPSPIDKLAWIPLRHALNLRSRGSAAILAYLLQHPDQAIRRRALASELGYSAQTIGVYVTYLRQDLIRSGIGDVLHTLHGAGYFITAADAERIRIFCHPPLTSAA